MVSGSLQCTTHSSASATVTARRVTTPSERVGTSSGKSIPQWSTSGAGNANRYEAAARRVFAGRRGYVATMSTKFHQSLQDQVRNEFTASQQYIALAVWFDGEDLPQLARHFYRQSLEERNHAMMIVQYLLDIDIQPAIPGISEVRNDFKEAAELIELALNQERRVTDEVIALAKAARDEDDYKGEQFMQWFLKEQVE